MTVTLHDSPESIATLADAWDALAGGHPLRGCAWATAWRAHYGDQSRPHVLAVRDQQQRVVGLAPWREELSANRLPVLRWIGDGEVCTDHLTLLAAKGHEVEVAAAVADYLTGEQTLWRQLRLDDADAGDPRLNRLTYELTQRGCLVQSRPAGNTWRVELPADWDAYLAAMSKNQRKQLRRLDRNLLSTDRCVWREATTHDEWEVGWQVLVDLHQRRRQSLGKPGCFASERFAAMHRQVSQALLEQGQLALSWLELDGQPVAAEYQFTSGDTTFAYQGGLDPDRLDVEPGRLSVIATLKRAMDAGRTRYDLMRGDEPYKLHWRARPHPTVHLRIAPPRLPAKWRLQAEGFGASVRRRLKHFRTE